MDDVNTDEMSENTNENSWVIINRTTSRVSNDETVQLPEVQKDLTNEAQMMQTINNGIEVLCENTADVTCNSDCKSPSYEYPEADDTSNDVSVITESDIDAHNANTLNNNNFSTANINDHMIQKVTQNCQSEDNKVLCMLGCVILGFISGIFCDQVSFASLRLYNDKNDSTNGIKYLQTDYQNIINTFMEMNATLNEIKTHILIEDALDKNYHQQLLKNMSYFNKMNSKLDVDSLNSNLNSLNNVQISLNTLLLLSNNIDDNNSLLKNEINKTLDIVNDIKVFYKTLTSFNSNSEITNGSIMEFLQDAIGKIHYTSHLLLNDLVKKINNTVLNVHYKYNKMRHKLNEKLCHLKNVLPDNSTFLKQLIEKSQLLSNYDKYCYSKNIPTSSNGKTNRKQNTKRQTKETDNSVLYTKFEKKDTQKIDTETYFDKVVIDYSVPTKIDQCVDETVNNSYDEIYKQNAETASDCGKVTTHKTKKYMKEPKSNNHFKLDASTKKVFNSDKPVKKKNISPEIKPKSQHVPKLNKEYNKHSFKDKIPDKDYYPTKSADWLFERSHSREELRQATNKNNFESPKSKAWNYDKSIDDMLEMFDKSMRKTMHLFAQKLQQIVGKNRLSRKK